MMAVAYPLVAWMTSRLSRLSELKVDGLGMAAEMARGSVFMLPYLWAYFFALEKITRRDSRHLPPQLLQRNLR
jgi:hypothetical protein